MHICIPVAYRNIRGRDIKKLFVQFSAIVTEYPKSRTFVKLPRLVQVAKYSYEQSVMKGISEDVSERKGYVGVAIN